MYYVLYYLQNYLSIDLLNVYIPHLKHLDSLTILSNHIPKDLGDLFNLEETVNQIIQSFEKNLNYYF